MDSIIKITKDVNAIAKINGKIYFGASGTRALNI